MTTSARLTLGALGTESSLFDQTDDEGLAGRGDAASFGVLYERHLPGVYRYLAGRVRLREEAEDLTSEVFRLAWASRHGYRRRGSFRAWLFSIVRRTLADHYRARRPAAQLEAVAAEQVLDGQPTPEDQAVNDERELETRILLTGLSQQEQEVLSLRFAAELTYAEIAIVIGKREEAVKKIAYRALESLRGRTAHA